MVFLLLFATVALSVILGITLLNLLLFPKLSNRAQASFTPRISVLIPARNEASIIGETLKSLLRQRYSNFEVLVLDDDSSDGTGEIARQSNDPRIRVVKGQPLPDGWLGKNWACYQLAQLALGEIFVFTDADVQWSDGGLEVLNAEFQCTDADLLTVWSTQISVTFTERLIVPMMALVVLGYLPVIGVHHTPFQIFAAANGQCMAWKREAYFKVGGHQSVRDNVLEDVTLARIAKRHRQRLRMADGSGLIKCRMYTNWSEVRDGYAKNILAGYSNSILLLVFATVFHWMIFIFPWVVFIGGFLITSWAEWQVWGGILILIGLVIRMLTAHFTHQRVYDSIFMPVSVLLMTVISGRAIFWHFQGGPSWKGRQISTQAQSTGKKGI